ncbi:MULTISPECIES: DUF6191 domain-containing protein [Streptomyces]|uniref:DUF6191 domain-containing protein n=1 Tax=Streptomyces decoyicus TaxID=249567 RepID=A0ABZ1FEX0_9ACTN|nr:MULTISPECIES: DUF6191 domain-containing protein [Streptomyces]MCL7490983.1 DUF6191 domain-containing protein [Streptomyces sp. MCA2]WSB68825.1 DUF6191 domain-containing protein [Streptomyces decoyicus]BDH14701.1 hypothetical protein HOK021_58800 [Streptomyces hygroscopicus]
MFNIAEELFAPGRKHTDEERQKMSLVVDDVGDGDPGKGPIDLSSGTVVVRAPGQRQDRGREQDRSRERDTERSQDPEQTQGPSGPEDTP